MAMFSISVALYLVWISLTAEGRHIDNRTDHRNHTVDTADANCLHACLDECLDWRNASFTSEDCLIPCAVYVEESDRLNNENGGSGSAPPHCNDTRGATIDFEKGEKPGKAVIKMTRVTVTNITEVWWTHVPTATAYRIEVWCRDSQNETLLFEDETWLSWYAFRQCHEKCPNGNRARVTAWNSFGVGQYSEFSDRLEESTNSTSTRASADEGGRSHNGISQ